MTWEAASGITSHWLTSNMVYGSKAGNDLTQYRWVNFCSGYASGSKYAVRLQKVNGMSDPFPNGEQEWRVGGYDVGDGPPKKSDRTVIFPDRTRWWLTSSADSMDVWLKQYPKGLHHRYRLMTNNSTIAGTCCQLIQTMAARFPVSNRQMVLFDCI